MDKFIIKGGKKLVGNLKVSGSKNAVLPIITASCLAEKGRTVLRNVPDLVDVKTMIGVIEGLGAKVEHDPNSGVLMIDAGALSNHVASYDLVRKMRASFLIMGPLLGRLGKAKVSLPGGCVLGPRPVDLHITGFKKLGAKVFEEGGYINASCAYLQGNTVFFDRPSHTGTENIMMAAALAKGKTTIINAACDPEVVDLALFLEKMGVEITGAGTPRIEIVGKEKLSGADHVVMPDRLVAGTYMLALGACGGKMELIDAKPADMEILIAKLSDAGLEFQIKSDRIIVEQNRRPAAVSVTTYPYPGFPTDLQAALMAFACTARGISYIRETVFTERFTHVMELHRLGADIKVSVDEAVITGVDRLAGASVMASDIRAGAALLIAALAASGESEVLRVYHIDRGYEAIEKKLQELGAEIERVG